MVTTSPTATKRGGILWHVVSGRLPEFEPKLDQGSLRFT